LPEAPQQAAQPAPTSTVEAAPDQQAPAAPVSPAPPTQPSRLRLTGVVATAQGPFQGATLQAYDFASGRALTTAPWTAGATLATDRAGSFDLAVTPSASQRLIRLVATAGARSLVTVVDAAGRPLFGAPSPYRVSMIGGGALDLDPATTAVTLSFEGALRLAQRLPEAQRRDAFTVLAAAMTQSRSRIPQGDTRQRLTIDALLDAPGPDGLLRDRGTLRNLLARLGAFDSLEEQVARALSNFRIAEYDTDGGETDRPYSAVDFPLVGVNISVTGRMTLPDGTFIAQFPAGTRGTVFTETPGRPSRSRRVPAPTPTPTGPSVAAFTLLNITYSRIGAMATYDDSLLVVVERYGLRFRRTTAPYSGWLWDWAPYTAAYSVARDPVENRLYVGRADGIYTVTPNIQGQTFAVSANLFPGRGLVKALARSRTRLYATVVGGGNSRLWWFSPDMAASGVVDLGNGTNTLADDTDGNRPLGIAVDDRGTTPLVYVGTSTGEVWVVRDGEATSRLLVQRTGRIRSLAVEPATGFLYSVAGDLWTNDLNRIDPLTGSLDPFTPTPAPNPHHTIEGMTISSDGLTLFLNRYEDV
jgi:hypothetical protein